MAAGRRFNTERTSPSLLTPTDEEEEEEEDGDGYTLPLFFIFISVSWSCFYTVWLVFVGMEKRRKKKRKEKKIRWYESDTALGCFVRWGERERGRRARGDTEVRVNDLKNKAKRVRQEARSPFLIVSAYLCSWYSNAPQWARVRNAPHYIKSKMRVWHSGLPHYRWHDRIPI